MSSRSRGKAGFTIIELMVVVGLIGAMSAIAIPTFLNYQARSRRSEAFVNLAAIARSQKSFFAEKDIFHDSENSWPNPALKPDGVLSATKMIWDADSEEHFAPLGWHPEGEVYYSYEVNTPLVTGAEKTCNCNVCFTATAYGDVNGNGKISAVMYVHPEGNGACMALFEDFGTPTRPGSDAPIYNEVAIQRSTDEY